MQQKTDKIDFNDIDNEIYENHYRDLFILQNNEDKLQKILDLKQDVLSKASG